MNLILIFTNTNMFIFYSVWKITKTETNLGSHPECGSLARPHIIELSGLYKIRKG